MGSRLEFIIGRAGTGKTEELYSRIAALKAADAAAECFVIVPEQATFETEKGLSERLSGGLFGCTVTSWKDAARRTLDLVGEKRAFLSSEGRIMLVRRAVDKVLKELTVFKKSAAHRGFPIECDTLIAKFKRCSFTSDDVFRAAECFFDGEPLKAKLRDIGTIFAELEEKLEGMYLDSEDMMRELVNRMGESPLKDAHIFIDGGDTVHEYVYPVFRALLTNAADVTVAMTLDTRSRDRELFKEDAFIFERLVSIAEETGTAYTVTGLTERKRPGTDAVRHLERELFTPDPAPFNGEPEGLGIFVAPGRLDEVAEAAERIRAAAGRMKYSDMAVIVSDMAGYAPIIQRIFPTYNIPYFADESRSLVTHPAARLILSALTAAESGFEARDVLEAVKTGYFDLTPDEAELFENCLLKTGISGKRLLEPFDEENAEYEDVRLRIMTPLSAFKEALGDQSCESRTRAIHAFMESLDLYGKQKELCLTLHGEGRYREENENAQVVNTILEVLDQLFVIMGGETVGMKRFINVVREGFEAYGVGMIPSTVNQVLVGSYDRTRSREVRLLIVLGMNDGLFPKPRKDDGVIDDSDLRLLKSKGFELWRSSESLSASDAAAVYQALSKATEEIVFSYPVRITGASRLDKPAEPCRLIQSLKKAFPLIPVRDGVFSDRTGSNEELAFMALSRKLRAMADSGAPDPEAAELVSWFRSRREYRPMLDAITDGLLERNGPAPLGKELASRLYGRLMYGSSTRLEAFNGCPFRHFLEFGLRAEEREERREKKTNLGSFYHEALEAYVRYVMDSDIDWKEIDDEKTFAILREIIPPLISKKGGHLLLDTARQRANIPRAIETVKYTCCAVTRHIQRGSFRPEGCEVTFGRADSVFPPLRIEADGAVFYISGVIDRIDRSGDMSRIIDYKSNGKDFDYAALMNGLQLQLPLYAAAIDSSETVGMYYMPVKDIAPAMDDSGEVKKELTDELMKNFALNGIMLKDAEVIEATDELSSGSAVAAGMKVSKDGTVSGDALVSADEFEYAVSFAKRKAANTLSSILDGEIAISPAKLKTPKGERISCKLCAFADVCLYDPELNPGRAREILPVKADTFFKRQ
ncbi:MAG: exodeoxyribonuclease V subunit gamma [Clostridiales bacterium]|nr:exodeoxyribonuclease V subunit gamma [Clostridiales bacterium]